LSELGLEEIEIIIKYFKNFKAPKEDEINPELSLKLVKKDLVTEIYLLIIKEVWKNECMTKD